MKKSIKILKKWIGINRIRICYSDMPYDDGSWTNYLSRITIHDDLDLKTELATLLHECGHYLDDYANGEDRAIDRAYNKYNAGVLLNNKEYRLVYQSEKRAWQNARRLAKQLKIRLGKWFDKEMRSSLAIYRCLKPSSHRTRG